MEIQTLKSYIIKNSKIEFVLSCLNCDNINSNHKEWVYSCYINGDNLKGICINKKTLAFVSMSGHGKGDLISLTMQILNLDLFNCIKWFMNILGLSDDTIIEIKTTKPFKGFYSNIQKYVCDSNICLKVYDENILNNYINKPSLRFLKDDISLETQKKYNIMFDEYSNRIIMPCYSENGIVGIIGRLNEDILYKEDKKYLPLIAFPKSQFLYGYTHNYKHLLNNRIYIFEAEKSVLQADSLGIFNTVSFGCSYISKYHKKIIYELNPTEVVLAFDEGIEETHIIEQCKKLKNKNNLLNFKVGYIYDEDNEYMKKYEKQSPIESGYWNELTENKIRWL